MKSFKKVFVTSFLCLIFVFSAALFATFSNYGQVVAEEGTLEGAGTSENPYLISSVSNLELFRNEVNTGNPAYINGFFKLEKSLNLKDIESWIPIGNGNAFKGTFEGNGKTIDNINLKDGYSLGLFGNLENARISNLGISVNVVLSEENNEGVITPNSQKIVGGFAGIAVNSTIFASYSKFNFQASRITRMPESRALEFYTKIEGSELVEEDGQITYEYETYSYMGELTVGAVVGKAVGSTISNSYSVPSLIIYQDGTNTVSSFFGGIVGWAKGGTVENVYVAPTDALVSVISSKNGNLQAVDAKDAPIVVNTSKDASSAVTFGGIVGLATEGELTVQNTLFSSVLASLSKAKLTRGGIIGQISTNSSDWPRQVMYGKYLSIANAQANIMSFSSGVGNGAEVGYSLNSSVSATNAVPTQAMFFKSWAWNEFRPWSEDVWKVNTSIITSMGYYFPALQKFASFTITITGSKEVAYTISNTYLSGYYTLQLDGITGKSYQYTAGQEVRIIATFYNEAGNPLRDFKNYFKFTNWLFGKSSVAALNYDGESTSQDGYNVTLDPQNGRTTISFIASSQTEGNYDVNIKGNPVTVNVSFRNAETNAKQENIGRITKKIGNNVETFVEDFSFVVDEYLSKEAITLTADSSENLEYIFANNWTDGNLTSQKTINKTIIVELNNGEKSSSSRFYPTVVSTSSGLVASVVAYFSNNTFPLSVSIKGEGQIKLNSGEEISSISERIINGTTINLEAVPSEGMQFVGWFNGEEELSKETIYEFVLTEETLIEARFEKIPEEKGGLPWWGITLIVGIPVLAALITTIVIVKVKGNSRRGYRKNYKF